jgi:hypothetical protein
MNQALLGKMNETRSSAPPELSGIVAVMDEFLRFAEEPIDDPALDRFGGALKFFTTIRERVWKIQRQAEPDVIARFRMRSAATITGLIVTALAELSPDIIDAQLERLADFVSASNAAGVQQRAFAESQELIKRNAEIEERARKMAPEKLVKEIEAEGAKLTVDGEARIVVTGATHQNAKLMISAARERVIGYLRDRQRAAERTEII